jgi:hypothetical protein
LFLEIEQCEIFMTEIDALRQERERFRGGERDYLRCNSARSIASRPYRTKASASRTSLAGWRGHARLEESSINTARDLSHPLAQRPAYI